MTRNWSGCSDPPISSKTPDLAKPALDGNPGWLDLLPLSS
jgi:hypothetical protein